jgi:type IV pilus assembly protein PilA
MRTSLRRSESGFTMIELLTVASVIGVLAAIALPLFLNQTNKANDADAKSAAGLATTVVQMYFDEHDTYAASVAELQAQEPSLAKGAGATLSLVPSSDGYELRVTSRSNAEFAVVRSPSGLERLCTHPGEGGCPASGHW